MDWVYHSYSRKPGSDLCVTRQIETEPKYFLTNSSKTNALFKSLALWNKFCEQRFISTTTNACFKRF